MGVGIVWWKRRLSVAIEQNAIDGVVARCLYCGKSIVGRSSRAKFCTDNHRNEASKKRKIYAQTEITHGRGEKLTPQRKGLLPIYHKIAAGKASIEQASIASGEGLSWVTRDYQSWRKAVEEDLKVGHWERQGPVKWMLGEDMPWPDKLDAEACAAWAVEMTERFMAFEREHFVVASGKPFIREEFHYEWITATLATLASGGYLQILSPPRHGKSELLVHFAVWMICVNPNVRILWVGPSEPIAASMLIAVRTYLEDSDRLIDDVLGPGRSFMPTSSAGRDWSSTSFTVATRTVTLVGSTMLAVGRGAKILSRNADVIVCDDIEDKSSVNQPKMRQETKDWFGTDLDSRKEEHTGLIVIGSRQHLDDLYAANLEDPNFYCIVNSAHDPDCTIDAYDEDAHEECMLFPQLRTYRWLMTKKRGAEARHNPRLYEMVYQNDPQGEGIAVFDEGSVKASRNPSRSIGLEGIPSGYRLIAGLDPAATGYQAAFLWAVRVRSTETLLMPKGQWEDYRLQRWMVDLDNTLGGGIAKAHEIMKRWLDDYGCHEWVVEINGFQRAIVVDPEITTWARANNVRIEPHRTGLNKTDPSYGVGSQDRLFRAGLIDLPYGDPVSRAKVDAYIKQLVSFSDDPVSQQRRTRMASDIVMASWFPTEQIRKWERQLRKESTPQETRSGYQKSYQNVTSVVSRRPAPWRHR